MGKRSDTPYSMWAEACALLDRAERLQRQFFHPPASLAAQASWEPPVDLFEADGALLIVAALPGVRAEALQLAVEGDVLSIAGTRGLPPESAGLAIRRLEIPTGRLERRIPLPPGPFELVEQRFADGCLTLLLRRG